MMQLESFTTPARVKSVGLGLLVIGLIMFVIGVLTNMDNPARIWTTLLATNHYFLLVGLAGLFFVASQTMGYNGWFVLIKRLCEAMAGYVKVGAILMIPILLFGMKYIYHWTDPHAAHDPILVGKAPYLNYGFFWLRSIIYLVGWSVFAFLIVRNSRDHDSHPGIKHYNSSLVLSAVFLLFFGVTSSTSAWDFLMSIDPHWYSTLYGWYTFISTFVASMAVVALMIIVLKSFGYLKHVTEEHLHDVGKFMFAFSVAWAYLWFSQHMLIWYANIPEETIYFRDRWENYPVLFFGTVVLNFVFPLLVLISRGAKRRIQIMFVACLVIIFGHWLDFYMMAMPGSMKAYSHTLGHDAAHHFVYPGLGLLEIGAFLTFCGLFTMVVFWELSKASLVPVNHPYIKESIIHHT